jgi:hypothetical protein
MCLSDKLAINKDSILGDNKKYRFLDLPAADERDIIREAFPAVLEIKMHCAIKLKLHGCLHLIL